MEGVIAHGRGLELGGFYGPFESKAFYHSMMLKAQQAKAFHSSLNSPSTLVLHRVKPVSLTCYNYSWFHLSCSKIFSLVH